MKKKFFSLLIAFTMAVSLLTGCADDEWIEDEYYGEDSDDEESEDEYEEDYEETETPPSTADGVKGLSMSVNNNSGELTIDRMSLSLGDNKTDDNTWTIFVYICGTDLESDNSAGTGDLDEMMQASPSDNVRFIVETGGTNQWNNDNVDCEKLQRFLIQNGEMTVVDEKSLDNMGSKDTLSDFLSWGVETYPSEHMGLILWNHGGGSITGVCFDEMHNSDSIDLMELDTALYDCAGKSGRKFDFIGFDACLMGTIETANILATYADYMYGSEESEPGSGWDYNAIGSFLAEDSDADGAELGKVVCDSFLESCEREGDSDITTLSVTDLSKMDMLLTEFNTFAKNMYESDNSGLAEIVREIREADNFGGNNKSEGYTNMVDVGGIVSGCSSYVEGSDAVLAALKDAVVYKVSGSTHPDAMGLSMYYPLSVQGSNELSLFSKVSVSPYYVSFVDRQNKTGATDESLDDYNDDQWFSEDGEWEWGEAEDDGHWDYCDDYQQTGESQFITFAANPDVNDEGVFGFTLDEDGINNAAGVSALVYELAEDGQNLIELGETIDISGDWETGVFTDNFDGYWLSLPDGQNLAIYPAEKTEEYIIYTSPILLNGEETNLRMKQEYDSGEIVIEGAWSGIDDSGAADKNIVKIKNGDIVTPTYYSIDMNGNDIGEYTGLEYTVSGQLEIVYNLMEAGSYQYSFCIDDIYGDYYATDYVEFTVSGDGEITF